MAFNVISVANELLRLASNSQGDLMTNLKLQKMLYYQQGFHLAYFGTPLFEEVIEAWKYGPVVPVAYRHYEHNGRNGIEPDKDLFLEFCNKEERNLFLRVYDIYSRYSAYGLMEMTHNESPWKDTPVGVGNVISHEKMESFFKTRLTE